MTTTGEGIEGLGSTAFITAQWRADELTAPSPLAHDWVAPLFCTAESRGLASVIAETLPEARYMILIRTRYIDDYLERVRNEVEQVVILGSGFDSRAVRYATPGITYFEVDHGAVLEYKAKVLGNAGHRDVARYVAADYTSGDLVSELVAIGFDPSLATLVIWEGNTFYLNKEDVLIVLRSLRDAVPRFRVMFDYFHERVIEGTTGYEDADRYAEHFARLGAPFINGYRNVDGIARETRLAVLADERVKEVFEGYRPGTAVNTDTMRFHFIATLASS